MITFDVYQLWPKFLLRDQTGYAMAKALEAGLKALARKRREEKA